MKKIECYLVRDLLPLYIDHACGPETAEDIVGHLDECAACKKLYDGMNSSICDELPAPELDDREFFAHVRKRLLGLILILTALIGCFAINFRGGWMGGPATGYNLAATLLYSLFWCIFSVMVHSYEPLNKAAWIISLITCISAVSGLASMLFDLSIMIAMFAGTLFYGLRVFAEWTQLYAVATIVSVFWLCYNAYYRGRMRRR